MAIQELKQIDNEKIIDFFVHELNIWKSALDNPFPKTFGLDYKRQNFLSKNGYLKITNYAQNGKINVTEEQIENFKSWLKKIMGNSKRLEALLLPKAFKNSDLPFYFYGQGELFEKNGDVYYETIYNFTACNFICRACLCA